LIWKGFLSEESAPTSTMDKSLGQKITGMTDLFTLRPIKEGFKFASLFNVQRTDADKII